MRLTLPRTSIEITDSSYFLRNEEEIKELAKIINTIDGNTLETLDAKETSYLVIYSTRTARTYLNCFLFKTHLNYLTFCSQLSHENITGNIHIVINSIIPKHIHEQIDNLFISDKNSPVN